VIAIRKLSAWLRPVSPAGVVVFSLALAVHAAAGAAFAQSLENVVSVEPVGVRVAPGGSFEVAVETHPPEQSVAAWVVELAFDPAFVSAESEDCLPLATPAGAVGASGCEVVDTNGDGTVDTAKIFGAVLFGETELGLQEEAALARITFTMAQGVDACTILHLRITIHADAEGDETGARVRDGRVCADVTAPPAGTPEATDIPIRTSEPPPEDGATVPPLDPSTGGGATGGGGGSTGGGGGGTAVTGAPFGTTPGSSAATSAEDEDGTPGLNGDNGESDGGGDAGDGGVSPVIWAVLGVLALGAVGGGAWYMVRMRGNTPPTGDETS
jgi:hypothetical protein